VATFGKSQAEGGKECQKADKPIRTTN